MASNFIFEFKMLCDSLPLNISSLLPQGISYSSRVDGMYRIQACWVWPAETVAPAFMFNLSRNCVIPPTPAGYSEP